jgi:hypothetical protein
VIFTTPHQANIKRTTDTATAFEFDGTPDGPGAQSRATVHRPWYERENFARPCLDAPPEPSALLRVTQ